MTQFAAGTNDFDTVASLHGKSEPTCAKARTVLERVAATPQLACTSSERLSVSVTPQPDLPQPGAAQSGAERVQIWYRSGPGCPDGVVFTELLSRRGRAAALAGVGDRVDFVVTLAGAEQGSSDGQLKRPAV